MTGWVGRGRPSANHSHLVGRSDDSVELSSMTIMLQVKVTSIELWLVGLWNPSLSLCAEMLSVTSRLKCVWLIFNNLYMPIYTHSHLCFQQLSIIAMLPIYLLHKQLWFPIYSGSTALHFESWSLLLPSHLHEVEIQAALCIQPDSASLKTQTHY